MVLYRRHFIPGGTYFFTLTLLNRRSTLLIERVDLLKEAIAEVKQQHPFSNLAYVILPDHLHCIWQLPPEDQNYSLRWQKIKSGFSKKVRRSGVSLLKSKHNEFKLWQRRFWEHTVRNECDFANHVDYIHYNPVKHGLVKRVVDWPYSSFHHYVNNDILPLDWSGSLDSYALAGLYLE